MRTDLKGSTGSGTIDADVVSENRRRRTARSDRAQHASASGAPERLLTDIVERMDIRGASGTVFDHLFLLTREDARARIGISS